MIFITNSMVSVPLLFVPTFLLVSKTDTLWEILPPTELQTFNLPSRRDNTQLGLVVGPFECPLRALVVNFNCIF
jgi:hypothetical protein